MTDALEKPAPTSIALKGLGELELFIGVAHIGLDWAQALGRIDQVLKRSGSETSKLDRAAIEEFAKSQAQNDFPYLWESAAVRIWSILETCVDDLVLRRLEETLDLADFPVLRSLKGSLIEFGAMSRPDQLRHLLNLLYDSTKSRLLRGAGRFEALLNSVGLGGGLDDIVRRELFALSEIRNAIVHNNGRVDERLASCGFSSIKVGDRVPVSGRRYEAWLAAAHWYLIELAVRGEAGETDVSKARDVQGVVIASLARIAGDSSESQGPPHPG